MSRLTLPVAALQYYHVASILLEKDRASPFELDQHARIVCGLALSSNSEAVIVNSYAPICFSRSLDGYTDCGADFCRLQVVNEGR